MRTSTNFAQLASFQAIEFVDGPALSAADIAFIMSSSQAIVN